MNIKVDWPSTVFAILATLVVIFFPFLNPCQTEDASVCTWSAESQGNGSGTSFTDFYGLVIPHG